MSEFTPVWAEMRDTELATTQSRINPWRQEWHLGAGLLPAVRAVTGDFSTVPPEMWMISGKCKVTGLDVYMRRK